MKRRWEVKYSAQFQLGFLRQLAKLLFVFCPEPLPGGHSSHQDLSTAPTEESTLFLPPLSGPIRAIGASQTSCTPPAASFSEPPQLFTSFPSPAPPSDRVFLTDYQPSPKPQNPPAGKIPLSGRRGNVRDCRACSLKYKDSFRVFIRVYIVVVCFHNQPGTSNSSAICLQLQQTFAISFFASWRPSYRFCSESYLLTNGHLRRVSSKADHFYEIKSLRSSLFTFNVYISKCFHLTTSVLCPFIS